MTEVPCTVLVNCGIAVLSGLGEVDELDDDERIKIEKLYPVMRKRKQWLEELVRLRNYEMNGMRHNFLFS